jgi:hypothetical protein
MVRDAKAGAGSNKIVYWSRLSDWKNQTLTPNPDAVYFMPFFDTKDVGSVVLEIPPADEGGSITGSVMDCWQAPLEDVEGAALIRDAGRRGCEANDKVGTRIGRCVVGAGKTRSRRSCASRCSRR